MPVVHADWGIAPSQYMFTVSSMSAHCTDVRAAEFSAHTCAVTHTVDVDAAPLSCSLVTAAVLDAPAGPVVTTDVCCPLCKVPAADAERIMA